MYINLCVYLSIYLSIYLYGLSRWHSGKEPAYQCRRHKRFGFSPWALKISWRRKWQPNPVFSPGKFHGLRSLVGYSPWGHKESDMTEHAHTLFNSLGCWLKWFNSGTGVSESLYLSAVLLWTAPPLSWCMLPLWLVEPKEYAWAPASREGWKAGINPSPSIGEVVFFLIKDPWNG